MANRREIAERPTITTTIVPEEALVDKVTQGRADRPKAEGLDHSEFRGFWTDIVQRLLTEDDAAYKALQQLKLVFKYLNETVNLFMFSFIQEQYREEEVFSGRIKMLHCEDVTCVPACLISNQNKVFNLYCFALRNLEDLACQIFVEIYNKHIDYFIGITDLYHVTTIKNKDSKNFSLVGLFPDNDKALEINSYLFFKVLEKYMLRPSFMGFVNDSSDDVKYNIEATVSLLKRNICFDDGALLCHLIGILPTAIYMTLIMDCAVFIDENNLKDKGHCRVKSKCIDVLFNLCEQNNFQFRSIENEQGLQEFALAFSDNQEIVVNKYIFIEFLERYILNPALMKLVSERSEDAINQFAIVGNFLLNNVSLKKVSNIIDDLLIIFAAPSHINGSQDMKYMCASNLAIFALNNLIDKKTAHDIFPKVLPLLSSTQDIAAWVVEMLTAFVRSDFLDSKEIEQFREKVSEFMQDNVEATLQANAIRIFGVLISKKLIFDKGIIDKVIEKIRSNDINDQIRHASLYFLALIVDDFLEFKRADSLVGKIIKYISSESADDRVNVCLFIKSLVKKGLDKTKNTDELVAGFIVALSDEDSDIREDIFDVCNILLEAKKDRIEEKDIAKLKEIARKDLVNKNEVIYRHAAKMFSLVATPKEQHLLILNYIVQCYNQSSFVLAQGEGATFVEFLQNLNQNVPTLTEKVEDLIEQQRK